MVSLTTTRVRIHVRDEQSHWPIILAIFCLLVSATGAGLVDYVSSGKPTTSWKTRRSVIVAILAPIITIFFAILLSTAFNISWRGAAETGTIIEHLNVIWGRGFCLRKSTWKTAIFSTKGFERLAMVPLLEPVGNFLYNPVSQLSTTASHTGAEADSVSLTLNILPEIHNGLASLSYTGPRARMNFTAAAVQWYREDAIRTKDRECYRCNGTCRGTVVAPSIVATCTNKTTFMDLSKTSTDERWFFRVNRTYERTTDNYMVHVLRSTYTSETAQDCTLKIVIETCVIKIGQVATTSRSRVRRSAYYPEHRRIGSQTMSHVLRPTIPRQRSDQARCGRCATWPSILAPGLDVKRMQRRCRCLIFSPSSFTCTRKQETLHSVQRTTGGTTQWTTF